MEPVRRQSGPSMLNAPEYPEPTGLCYSQPVILRPKHKISRFRLSGKECIYYNFPPLFFFSASLLFG